MLNVSKTEIVKAVKLFLKFFLRQFSWAGLSSSKINNNGKLHPPSLLPSRLNLASEIRNDYFSGGEEKVSSCRRSGAKGGRPWKNF
jgi:hypothetical protein